MKEHVGIVGMGLYIPKGRMTAKEIAEETKGNWTEQAIIEKLGIVQKVIPGEDDGTQEMGVRAAVNALENTRIDPEEIDLIICIGEEWKEYPLTTSGIYIQEKIGAKNAWAIDVQQRCCTTVSAMKIAKDIMLADKDIKCVMIVGGYRNGDFIDYTDNSLSMMYNLAAGGGAIILKKNYGKNLLLGSHIITDGSLARDVGVEFGGIVNPINAENLPKAYKSLKIFDEQHMKERLNEVSMKNWLYCIDKAFEKSGIGKEQLGYLAVLHFKYSMHKYLLDLLGLTEEQSIYLKDYGHIGQIDQILSLQLALEQGKIKDGTVISMIAAGIGYAWAANVIKWGPVI
ncbi:3-oxoacyl-[acyl-carrier-protein] synthase-3 [Anaerobranca californiensis DSM 14826]|uniref:3-oxoacyl-[acyl-carrier-protein] synthase-3 n=1 Tax=Anaerobranca californiensis DSM 14826 TaxID=1120989 RepID=A0A1M6NTS5_9FIRM|nr:3-oxoacyl-ACP synthase [Anaerobranca californiensis]SHJ99022.1 3-oxoacyl-[acyl-carrier-protein] synthase-3 [Anaerobranca californiensis DSM 14826]